MAGQQVTGSESWSSTNHSNLVITTITQIQIIIVQDNSLRNHKEIVQGSKEDEGYHLLPFICPARRMSNPSLAMFSAAALEVPWNKYWTHFSALECISRFTFSSCVLQSCHSFVFCTRIICSCKACLYTYSTRDCTSTHVHITSQSKKQYQNDLGFFIYPINTFWVVNSGYWISIIQQSENLTCQDLFRGRRGSPTTRPHRKTSTRPSIVTTLLNSAPSFSRFSVFNVVDLPEAEID